MISGKTQISEVARIQMPPPALVFSDHCRLPGAAAVGAWAQQQHPPGSQDLPRDYGPDGAAGELSWRPHILTAKTMLCKKSVTGLNQAINRTIVLRSESDFYPQVYFLCIWCSTVCDSSTAVKTQFRDTTV